MANWKFDITKTQQRYQELQEYYRKKKLNADDFECAFFQRCLASQRTGTVKQYAGGTAALMPLYDVQYCNVDVRVLVVGKETGYMANTTYGTSPNYDENTLNVLNCINWRRKNNHIRGTLITLQRIFELDTEYIYASYALSDALRCAFQYGSSIDSVSSVQDTSTMRQNCLNYLVDEIIILDPTLVIIQGEWAIRDTPDFVQRLATSLNVRCNCLKMNQNKKYGLYEFPSFMCITSHHPAILGHWIANLAPDSLWPMIAYLKDIGYIPTISPEDASLYEEIVKPIIDPIINILPSNDRLRQKISSGFIQETLF